MFATPCWSIALINANLKITLQLRSSLKISEISFIESAKNQIQRGNRESKVLERYLIESGATSLILMDMNIHQLALSGWKYSKKNPISISGILFNHLNPPERKTLKIKALKVI